MNQEENIAYGHDVLEFVTVSVQYCAFLEDCEQRERADFLDVASKLLPLLYLKASLLPLYETFSDSYPQPYVTEENYDIVRSNIAMLMRDRDDYLDVFVEDMKYSEEPILMTISENLADIYQNLKNFVCAYKMGLDEEKISALEECKTSFEHEWGQKLVNVLRAIHEVKYSSPDDEQ